MNPTGWERLFFALWPDLELRQQIDRRVRKVVKRCGGRPVPADNLHITLFFLGSVDQTQRAVLERAAAEIDRSAFNLTLDRWGYWPKPKIFWLGCAAVTGPLLELAQTIAVVAKQSGFKPESRPYHPHVTLARKVACEPAVEPPEPLIWQVTHFALVRSTTYGDGANYEVVQEWPLVTS